MKLQKIKWSAMYLLKGMAIVNPFRRSCQKLFSLACTYINCVIAVKSLGFEVARVAYLWTH